MYVKCKMFLAGLEHILLIRSNLSQAAKKPHLAFCMTKCKFKVVTTIITDCTLNTQPKSTIKGYGLT